MFKGTLDEFASLIAVMRRRKDKSNRGFLVKVYVEDADGKRDRLVAVDDDGDAKTSGRGARPSVTETTITVRGRHDLKGRLASITLYGTAGEIFHFPCEIGGQQGLEWSYEIGGEVWETTFNSRSLASRVGRTA